jgi:hypothetical protein
VAFFWIVMNFSNKAEDGGLKALFFLGFIFGSVPISLLVVQGYRT